MSESNKLKELIVQQSRSGNVSLYAEAQEQGMSLSELLEEIDPSEPNSKLDAFERQLMLHGILAEGSRSISMEQFFVGGGLILLPEYVLREIRRGYKMVQDPTELVASVSLENGPTVRPIYIQTTKAKESMAKKSAGSAYPRVELLYRDKEANIIDRGREFDFSYRIVRNQKLTEFRVFLWWIGAQMAYDEIDEMYNILLYGDGTSDGATDVFNGNAGTFAYSDLVHLAMSFDVPARMTHVVAAKADIETIINLSQFQDAQAWRENELFARTGNRHSFLPVNAKLVVAPNATATEVIGLDSRFALRESVTQPLMVDVDKVINQKLEQAVVSKESVYTIMVDDAALLSDY